MSDRRYLGGLVAAATLALAVCPLHAADPAEPAAAAAPPAAAPAKPAPAERAAAEEPAAAAPAPVEGCCAGHAGGAAKTGVGCPMMQGGGEHGSCPMMQGGDAGAHGGRHCPMAGEDGASGSCGMLQGNDAGQGCPMLHGHAGGHGKHDGMAGGGCMTKPAGLAAEPDAAPAHDHEADAGPE